MVDSGVPKAHRVLDCIGLYCPMPVLNTRQEMDKIAIGEILEVWADDPAAEEDIRLGPSMPNRESLRLRRPVKV